MVFFPLFLCHVSHKNTPCSAYQPDPPSHFRSCFFLQQDLENSCAQCQLQFCSCLPFAEHLYGQCCSHRCCTELTRYQHQGQHFPGTGILLQGCIVAVPGPEAQLTLGDLGGAPVQFTTLRVTARQGYHWFKHGKVSTSQPKKLLQTLCTQNGAAQCLR